MEHGRGGDAEVHCWPRRRASVAADFVNQHPPKLLRDRRRHQSPQREEHGCAVAARYGHELLTVNRIRDRTTEGGGVGQYLPQLRAASCVICDKPSISRALKD